MAGVLELVLEWSIIEWRWQGLHMAVTWEGERTEGGGDGAGKNYGPGDKMTCWGLYMCQEFHIYIFQSVFLPYYLSLLLLDPVTAGPGGEKWWELKEAPLFHQGKTTKPPKQDLKTRQRGVGHNTELWESEGRGEKKVECCQEVWIFS